MALDRWTRAPDGTNVDQLGAYEYIISKEFESSFSTNNSATAEVYFVAWTQFQHNSDNLQNFLSDVLGYSYLPQPRSALLKRVLPERHKDFTFFYAADAKVEGYGTCNNGANGTVSYPSAKITVAYRPLPYAVKHDDFTTHELQRFVTRKFGITGQYLSVNGMMKFVSKGTAADPMVLPTQPGKIIGSMDLEYVWSQVPSYSSRPYLPPNITNVTACLGKVNSTAFDVDGLNAPPGTVLFDSIDPRMIMPTLGGPSAAGNGVNTGQVYWELTLKFKYMDNGAYTGGVAALAGETAGHNYVWRTLKQTGSATPTTPLWDLVTNDGTATGARIYQSANLNNLFSLA